MKICRVAMLAALALMSGAAFAQTIKIGFITSYSGLNANLGPYMERAVRLYIKQHGKELPPGVKIELLVRDDTGVNPDRARRSTCSPAWCSRPTRCRSRRSPPKPKCRSSS